MRARLWPYTVFEVLATRPVRIDGFADWDKCLGWGRSPLAQRNRIEVILVERGSSRATPERMTVCRTTLGMPKAD